MSQWFSKKREQVLRELESDRAMGLSAKEAQVRLLRCGPNQLEKPKKESLLQKAIRQMKDPMILVLLAAAVLSVWASGGEDLLDAGIILAIVLVNACISISQEDNAHKALEALEEMTAPVAHVLRDGVPLVLAATELVPGDVIRLEAGDYVPADGRLLESVGLRVDEFVMTGESLPVEKEADLLLEEGTPLGDRRNMVLSSTIVTAGRGTVLITETGMDSEVGRIAGLLLRQKETETPLQKKMGEISKMLSLLCLGVCAVLFAVGLLQHRPMLDMFMMAVSLAVAAIPEGLPAIVTIVLAVGVSRMAKRNAIIKKLPAVETLGCASVICSDKTGTLTQNDMTIVELWPGEPPMEKELLMLGSLCNDTTVVSPEAGGALSLSGDPTEKAFIKMALQRGIDKRQLEKEYPRKGEQPFDSERKRMSTLHQMEKGTWRLVVKGAPEVILARSTSLRDGAHTRRLTENDRDYVCRKNDGMATRALCVLAVAYRDFREKPDNLIEEDLVFLGLVGMIDPPRPEATEAVTQCYEAGIQPVMITGDHKKTALAIAKELHIFRPGDRAITGEELDFLPQGVLEEEIQAFTVFARVTPEHKLRIVEAWQKKGHVVAMTGDGVNDAPALKAADIGCAMGKTGTDVAKGASDMILTDDHFTSVVSAVEQGRGIYSNIKKAIHYLLSCNIGEILTIFVATVFAFPQMPLTPVQLLWLNLVTESLPALALGMEPVEEDVMTRAPRDAKEPLFNKAFSINLLWQGMMVGGLTLLSYWLGHQMMGGERVANTMAFATLTLCQLFHAFDVRSEEQSLFHIGIFSNKAMNKAFLFGVALQMAVLLLPPLQAVFSVTSLTISEWSVVFFLAVLPLPICETVKGLQKRKVKGKREKVSLEWPLKKEREKRILR